MLVRAFWEWDFLHSDKLLAPCDELQTSSLHVRAKGQNPTVEAGITLKVITTVRTTA